MVPMTTEKINIARDYTTRPGGRYLEDGDGNGTEFREKFLLPIIASGKKAEIIFDGASGYPSSFLEEAFGGLVRKGYLPDQILSTFEFIADDPSFGYLPLMIEKFVHSAKPSE